MQIDSIIAQCSAEPPTAESLAKDLGQYSHEEFCVAFCARVASEYMAGRLSFEAADAAVSWLHYFCYVDADRGMPDFPTAVHAAFDQGEYVHSGDPLGTDPVEKYTRPLLEQVAIDYGSLCAPNNSLRARRP